MKNITNTGHMWVKVPAGSECEFCGCPPTSHEAKWNCRKVRPEIKELEKSET